MQTPRWHPVLPAWLALGLLLLLAGPAQAQQLDVAFRYQPEEAIATAYVRGDFNGWSANSSTEMTFVDSLNQWVFFESFNVGTNTEYKIFVHFNESGSSNAWLTDPWNPDANPDDNNNSVLTVTDPMAFQGAREPNADGFIEAVSAGLFGSEPFTEITFTVNTTERDGLPFYNPETGLFRYVLDAPIAAGARFALAATDATGRSVSFDVGMVLQPLSWLTTDLRTVQEAFPVKALVTALDGTVDPAITEATLLQNGEDLGAVAVTDGVMETTVALDPGVNTFQLQVTLDQVTYTSDVLTINRRLHPLESFLVMPEVSGGGLDFSIQLMPYGEGIPPDYVPAWSFDEAASTTEVVGDLIFTVDQMSMSGTATGPGALYFDIDIEDGDGLEDHLRVAVILEADGTVREMAYEETPAWVNNLVVYEIFPLSFGPEATGTPEAPGSRFQEITEELDYIAQMGFNAIWFMPIYDDLDMSQVSGGYNIVDFYTVDPKLGTNDDFKALVERAHELGLKIILDLTPSHVSPQHPWVESLREGGPFADYIQTTVSSHNRGLDNRGPNLAEIWHVENGTNLYRKYDGFGDLANLDWDNDDLQAEILDVIAYWVQAFDIDGWRMDVYWGPWRRYGPERFGRPIRELMKRIKPDAWILGEIAGTGSGTEVYYADDDNGTAVVGGIDAGYDWNYFFNVIAGTYGDIGAYDFWTRNGASDFWPGPHARYFRFLENHDEERIAERYETTPDRILPLTGMLLTTTGIPMVYQGQEAHFGANVGYAERAPVTWENPLNDVFVQTYQRLAHARAQYPAFGTQDIVPIHTTNSVYGYVRPYEDQNAVVLVNFGSTARTVSIDPSSAVEMTTDGPVPYYNIFADTSAAYLGGFAVTVPAYETVVYLTTDDPAFDLPPLPDLPFGATYTAIDADGREVPETVRLAQNYPNPFNPETTIRYTLPEAAPVRLAVYDLLGRRVRVLVDGVQPPGAHRVVFDAAGLPSGLYLYRLHAGREVRSRTMVLLK